MERGTAAWYAQVNEDVVSPGIEIIDPHHHLWPVGGALPYGLDGLHADAADGHNVVGTVFVECRASYRSDGPKEMAPVGETEFVAQQADASAIADGPEIKGIVAHADLAAPNLDDILDAHAQAGGSRFKGIRDAIARAPEPEACAIPGGAPEGRSTDQAFLAGLRRLGERGLTYDSWHYHLQNQQFAAMAASAPGTTMVLDHFGTPLGVGSYAGRLDETFETWKNDIALIAQQPNVVAKLGGLAMPDNGYGWHARDRPASSEELVQAHARWYHHTIECFGPDRCMFESNFPVDRFSISYRSLWNALKIIASSYTTDEQALMFTGTASRVYSLS